MDAMEELAYETSSDMPSTGLDLAMLRKSNVLRCERDWKQPLHSWNVAEWGNATAGEVGEACNVAKKMLRWDHNIRTELAGKPREEYKEDLASELADTLLYIDLWAASEGIDLGAAVRKAFNKKSEQIGSPVRI